VLHPICSSLRTVDITDTSITNAGLQQLCRRISNLSSLGEYSIRSLNLFFLNLVR
jgi:hypothetical protein